MPWTVSTPMTQRLDFVEDFARGHPDWTWPVASTVGELLKHAGLVRGSRRRRPPSPRPYPRQLPSLEYPAHYEVRLVSANGGIRWHHDWVTCSHVLCGEYVGFEEVEDGIWALYIGPMLLGRFHERDRVIISTHNRNRLKHPPPGTVTYVSGLSVTYVPDCSRQHRSMPGDAQGEEEPGAVTTHGPGPGVARRGAKSAFRSLP